MQYRVEEYNTKQQVTTDGNLAEFDTMTEAVAFAENYYRNLCNADKKETEYYISTENEYGEWDVLRVIDGKSEFLYTPAFKKAFLEFLKKYAISYDFTSDLTELDRQRSVSGICSFELSKQFSKSGKPEEFRYEIEENYISDGESATAEEFDYCEIIYKI